MTCELFTKKFQAPSFSIMKVYTAVLLLQCHGPAIWAPGRWSDGLPAVRCDRVRPKVCCGHVPYLLGQNSLILAGCSASRSEMPISHFKRAGNCQIVRSGKPRNLWLTIQHRFCNGCGGSTNVPVNVSLGFLRLLNPLACPFQYQSMWWEWLTSLKLRDSSDAV